MKRLTLLSAIVALSACGQNNVQQQATVDLDYANTSLGFRNSGALSSGRLLLWDTEEKQLVTLATDIPLATKHPTAPVRLEASSVRGAAINAGVDLTDDAKFQISSTIKNNLSFIVSDAVRTDSKNVYSAISSAYVKLQQDGVNAYRAWRIADAERDPNRYKLVLLRDEIRASDETISFDKSVNSSASFKVTDSAQGDITVNIPAQTTAKCSGQQAVCYVNATVLRVFVNDAGNLDYSPVGYSREALSRAFRDLG